MKTYRYHAQVTSVDKKHLHLFRKMFSCGLREAQNGEVNFHDIQGEVLEAVINFVYTGKVQVILMAYMD